MRELISQVKIKGKNVPDGRNSRCQGPESEGCLNSSGNNEETNVVGVG